MIMLASNRLWVTFSGSAQPLVSIVVSPSPKQVRVSEWPLAPPPSFPLYKRSLNLTEARWFFASLVCHLLSLLDFWIKLVFLAQTTCLRIYWPVVVSRASELGLGINKAHFHVIGLKYLVTWCYVSPKSPIGYFAFVYTSIFWYMQGNDWGSFISDSPEHITCWHTGGTKNLKKKR